MILESESVRKNLLLSLKESARKLTPFLHEGSSGIMFDEKNSHALQLCTIIEKCIFHGIKSHEFCGIMPFWGLLERLETTTPPMLEVRSSVGAVACVSSLRTPAGRARGWIRQALNANTFEATITALTKYHQRLLLFFYERDALLNVASDVSVLLAILRSLKVFKFNFSVDLVSLNYNPDWLTQQLHDQQQAALARATRSRSGGGVPSPRHTSRTTSSSSSSGGGSFFGGLGMGDINLFSSLEKGVDSVLNQAVKYLSDAMEGDDVLQHPPSLSAAHAAASSQSRGSGGGADFAGGRKSGRRLQPLFGSPLKALVLDETRCSVAYLSPYIGVPNMIALLVNAIAEAKHTEGLFRHRGPPADTHRVRASLESEQGIPPQTSIHTLTHCLLQWLYELPEPLLGYEVYDAMQSCQDIDSEEHRNRNLTLLIEEVPWYCQPTLALVMKLLFDISRPEVVAANGLNIVAVSVFATPFLLRHRNIGRLNGANMTPEEVDRAHMTAAAAGGAVVGILVEHMPDAFQLLLQSQRELANALTNKCKRLRVIQREAVRPVVLRLLDAKIAEGALQEDGSIDDDDEAVLSRVFGCPCDYSDFSERREEVVYDILVRLWVQLRHTHYVLVTPESGEDSQSTEEESLAELDDIDIDAIYKQVEQPAESTSSKSRLLRKQSSFSDSSLSVFYALGSSGNASSSSPGGSLDDGSLPASPTRLAALAASGRWAICFPLENPLKDFNSQLSGLLAIKCLTYFLQKYGEKASSIVVEFARKRKNLAPLPMVCAYLVQICLVGLKLVHPQSFSYSAAYERNKRAAGGFPTEEGDYGENGIPLKDVSRQKPWRLMSDEHCLEELFSVSLMTFDDLWKHLLPSGSPTGKDPASPPGSPGSPRSGTANSALAREVLASCMTGCRVLMDELLSVSSVVSVEQLWRVWVEQRVQRQQAVVEAQFKRRRQAQAQVVQKQPSQTGGPNSKDKSMPNLRVAPSKLTGRAVSEGVSKGQSDPQSIEDSFTYDSLPGVLKMTLGIPSRVFGDKDLMILTKEEIQMLEDELPMDMQCCDWELTYSLLRDGANIDTLLRACGGSMRTVLVIEDSGGRKFGGVVCDDAWHMDGDRYFGSGTCMVFTFNNKDDQEEIAVYKSSMKNEYYMLMSHTCVGMGGGGGGFALMLDGDLQYGSSYDNCETFESPCLATSNEFECYRCNLFVVHRV